MKQCVIDGITIEWAAPTYPTINSQLAPLDQCKTITTTSDGTLITVQAADKFIQVSKVDVHCPVSEREKLADLEIGFLQTVTASRKTAYYGEAQQDRYVAEIRCPIKDGQEAPWYQKGWVDPNPDADPFTGIVPFAPPVAAGRDAYKCIEFDADDVTGWTGTALFEVHLHDHPKFTFPEATDDDLPISYARVDVSLMFRTALAIKYNGAMSYLHWADWQFWVDEDVAASRRRGGYTRQAFADVPDALSGTPPESVIVDMTGNADTANSTVSMRRIKV